MFFLKQLSTTKLDKHLVGTYSSLSLIKLIEAITENSCRQALDDFHSNRTVFFFNNGRPMLFIDYLKFLRNNTAKQSWDSLNALEIADKAYDLTLDKFLRLPEPKEKSSAAQGINCKLYYNAFLDHTKNLLKSKQPVNSIEEEKISAHALQNFVRRHYYFSCLDAERQMFNFWTRYYWNKCGHTICVWLPVYIKGRQRKKWLENNINDPAPLKPGERQRIQEIINKKLAKETLLHIDAKSNIATCEVPPVWFTDDETNELPLAKVVAQEKASNIKKQRRSIQALGSEKLKQMVLRIFSDINHENYEDGKVARDFGVSKSTFSRFAGSRWRESRAIPDLWRNTARVLLTHPIFKEELEKSGTLRHIKETLPTINMSINT